MLVGQVKIKELQSNGLVALEIVVVRDSLEDARSDAFLADFDGVAAIGQPSHVDLVSCEVRVVIIGKGLSFVVVWDKEILRVGNGGVDHHIFGRVDYYYIEFAINGGEGDVES